MRRVLAAGVVVLAALALAAPWVPAERIQKGNLRASLQGGVSPLRLPRDRAAPVSLRLSGSLRTTDGSPLPRVAAMEFALAGRSGISTRGLPVCPGARIRHTRAREALAACGEALVGRGRLAAQVLVPDQPPFEVHARILIFNGRTEGGGTALLLHTYTEAPPIAVVIKFVLRHPPGRFGTALIAHGLGRWPRIAEFSMTLSRRFNYRGSRRSFLVGSCPLPRRFTSGLLSLARIEFTLAGGRRIGTEIVRTCRAR